MIMELSLMLTGVASVLAAWALPMVSDHLPRWFQLALIVGGLALIVCGASLGLNIGR